LRTTPNENGLDAPRRAYWIAVSRRRSLRFQTAVKVKTITIARSGFSPVFMPFRIGSKLDLLRVAMQKSLRHSAESFLQKGQNILL
jgi:hypothetical protein